MKNDLSHYDELVFCNDSCYGPVKPLADVWERMRGIKCDFWGLIYGDSHHKEHLQSYFLVFKKRVFQSSAFDSFIKSIRKMDDKWDVIIEYEVGLTQHLQQQGFRHSAMIEGRRKTNDCMYKPIKLLMQGFPFVKTSLLRDNPCTVRRLHRYKHYLEPSLNDIVLKHINRHDPESYKKHYYIIRNKTYVFFHKKFVKIRVRNKYPWCFLSVKLLGMTIFKAPILFSRQGNERQIG